MRLPQVSGRLTPCRTASDQVDRGLVDPKLLRHSPRIVSLLSSKKDRAYLVLVQFGSMVFGPSGVRLMQHDIRVPDVFFTSEVLKIARCVVSLVSVFVVDLFAGWARTEKRFRHDYMNEFSEVFLSAFDPTKRNSFVARGHLWFQDSVFVSTSAHEPTIAYFVLGTTRDGSPFHVSYFTSEVAR